MACSKGYGLWIKKGRIGMIEKENVMQETVK